MARKRGFDHQEILKKAQDLFWSKGYSDTSIQDLVEHLGLGRGSLYNAYGSKRVLFLEVLEYYLQRRTEYLQNLLSDAAISEMMRHFLYALVDEIVDDDEHKGCLIVNTRTQKISEDEEVREIISRSDQAQIGMLVERLNWSIEKEKRQFKQDVRAIALFFSNTIKGLRVFSRSNYSKEDLLSIVDTALIVLE